jgi:hypothetical protein
MYHISDNTKLNRVKIISLREIYPNPGDLKANYAHRSYRHLDL